MGEISDKQQAISDTSDDLAFSDEEKTVINNNLQVLGKATVEDLGVTGRITSGLLVIEGLSFDSAQDDSFDDAQAFGSEAQARRDAGASIYTLSGKLKLQELALGEIEMMGGKILFDTKGNVKVIGEITARKYNVDTSDVAAASAGRMVISAGESRIEIETKALTEDSLIFVTPGRPVVVGSRWLEEGKFEIVLQESLSEDLEVSWWVIN
jgi:hypothetical protein